MSTPTVAESLARAVARARGHELPARLRATLELLLVDIGGLCVAARRAHYVGSAIAGWEGAGRAAAIGPPRALDAAGGAVVHTPAPHGQGFRGTIRGRAGP